MGMEKDALLGLHQELVQPLSVAYYPQCSMPDKALGLSAHSDKGSLGIVMQEDDVTGLQIKHRGKWVPIEPISDAFVVNVGDIIEVRTTYFSLFSSIIVYCGFEAFLKLHTYDCAI